ncbi:N-acetylmuramoyl-L-alanine amidase [Streptomyces sp. NPDC058694]|uniref:N-acetylmuramoyl-L-alanine amidase n=1 Tax=Streptomyces sp. NPDC058694 TaxID=3346603 RepID=UPI003651AA31
MATPLSADRLVAALKAEGLRVVEYKSWRTHNRNSKGAWGPINGVMLHHTVTKGTATTVSLCYNGHSDLPGPLCHGVIAKDGTVYLVGNGRANHAGKGDDDVLKAVVAEKALPADNEANTDGNPHFYGFECENLGDGKDPWPEVQADAMARASAAICRAYGWSERSVIGHLEWQPGKVDPRTAPGGADVSMAKSRARIAERLKHAASWSPGKAPAPPTTPAPKPTTEQRLSALEKTVTAQGQRIAALEKE